MKDVFMFCANPECGICEDKCCQECNKQKTCNGRCESMRYKERIYSDDNFLAEQLDALSEEIDNWLVAVAAERIREISQEKEVSKCN